MAGAQTSTVLLLLLCTAAAAASQQDPYQVLGVRRSATKTEITQAFRRLSRQWHPDKNSSPQATQKFQEISAAYEALTDPTKAKTIWETTTTTGKRQETTDEETPASGFTATFGTVQFVLDLDPNRLRELLTMWSTDWAGKNWKTFGPLWASPVDKSVCWCLENAWRLPKLTEPVSKLLAAFKGVKHREGSWRAWRLSGALLELSAWSSRQQPCLRHHLAARSNSTQEDVLARLQQQLETRCKARRAAVEASRRRHKRQQADDAGWANSDDDMPAASHDTQADSLKISAGQGGLVWCVLLLGVSGMLFIDDRLLVTSGLAAAGLLAAAVSRGLLLPDEASIQQLGRMLHAGGMRANLVGLAFVFFCMAVGVLLPLLLAACAFLVITWLWACGTFVSIGSTPAMSQAGFALMILVQTYAFVAGGDMITSALMVLLIVYGLWKMPRILQWWAGLLFAPVVFCLVFIKQVLKELVKASGLWWSSSESDNKVPAAAAAAAQQVPAAIAAAAAAAARLASAAAFPTAAPAPRAQSEQQQSPQQSQTRPQQQQQQQQDEQPPSTEDTSQQADASNRTANKSSSSKSKRKALKVLKGAWWPKSFAPADIAVTCHWYSKLLGWDLALWALGVAAISCKLTLVSVLFAVTSAAFGAPVKFLTLQNTVRLLLLRGGIGVGLLWELWKVLML